MNWDAVIAIAVCAYLGWRALNWIILVATIFYEKLEEKRMHDALLEAAKKFKERTEQK